jgi:hypothetical protein
MANSETVRLRTDAWQTNRAYELIITRVRDASINSNLIQMATPVPISFFRRNVTALPAGSFWAWDDSGMDLRSDWREPDYPDTAWPRGQAGFYFGSRTMPFCGASKSTWITFGYTTYYFRTAFQLTDAAGFGHLRLRHFVDDAAVFYLNGVEVGRVRMPMGTIDAYTPPAVATNLPGCQTLSLSVSNLVTGQNVLAVELHDALPDGFADLAFDLELAMDYVFVPPTPRLEMHISRLTDGALELDWTGGPGTLLHAPQPQGPWATLGTNNPAVFLPTNAAGFFRVQGL